MTGEHLHLALENVVGPRFAIVDIVVKFLIENVALLLLAAA